MTVFVPGPLRNPMNGSHGHWTKHRRWAKDWRERTHYHLWLALRLKATVSIPTEPKIVRFVAHTHNGIDDDNLRAMLKPCRDGLKDARIIHNDGKDSGHVFLYDQEIDRSNRGVEITWELK